MSTGAKLTLINVMVLAVGAFIQWASWTLWCWVMPKLVPNALDVIKTPSYFQFWLFTFVLMLCAFGVIAWSDRD